jgi:CMP-N-acetylneuraminic acid synthetase
MSEVVALVTARGGSKGIPRKNLCLLADKPLIAWSILAALGCRPPLRVLVSTDDAEIAHTARAWGAEVPFLRPPALARDDSPHLAVVLHALDWVEQDSGRLPDYLLLLQPTSPLRTSEDIECAIALAHEKNADSVVGVCTAHHHPWLVKRATPEGWLVDYVENRLAYPRRQDFPPALALNGALYLIRPQVLREQRTFLPARTCPYIMPAARSLDIDDSWDLHLARLIMEDRTWFARASTSMAERLGPAVPASSLRKPA